MDIIKKAHVVIFVVLKKIKEYFMENANYSFDLETKLTKNFNYIQFIKDIVSF